MTQLAIDFNPVAAASARDRAIDRAESHADAVVTGWSASAYDWLCAYAKTHERFMAEDVRAAAHAAGFPEPPDGRAWGGCFMRASREGLIVRIGYAPMKSKNCHGNPKSVWESSSLLSVGHRHLTSPLIPEVARQNLPSSLYR